jgi:hypothetical protein
VAVDAEGDVYFANWGGNNLEELPRAFVDTCAKIENAAAFSDTLAVVLPATQNLSGPFAPINRVTWLSINGVSNGALNFDATANTSPINRTASLLVLGQEVSVTQLAAPTQPCFLGMTMTPGGFQLTFSNYNESATMTILGTTNLGLPMSQWTTLGVATNMGGSMWQFTDTQASNTQSFYAVKVQP